MSDNTPAPDVADVIPVADGAALVLEGLDAAKVDALRADGLISPAQHLELHELLATAPAAGVVVVEVEGDK